MFFERVFLLLVWTLLLVSTLHANPIDLPFGQVNVVVLTDVHSWVAGHARHERHLNVDYGHVLSFYQQLQNSLQTEDLFFVMNGDFIDGTGLSTNPPDHLVPILEQMPWDAVNIGNHELYKNSTIEYITEEGGFIDHWDGHYLTSNVVHVDTLEPLGNRFTILQGNHSRVLTFGFLFNFTNNCPLTVVEPVQQVVEAEWFVKAVKEEQFDAVLVLAHMDVDDPLVHTILNAIRSIRGPSMPVQFITGHTHYRGYSVLDELSTSFEAGRYLDTVGFASFPTVTHSNETTIANKTELFHHAFIDANIDSLGDTLGTPNYTTPDGASLSRMIQNTEESMGLLQVLGCSPRTYYLERGLSDPQSLWGLYLNKVIEGFYFQQDAGKIYLQGVGAFRYDLFVGEVTLTDLISVSPYNDTVYMVAQQVQGSDLLKALGTPPNQPDPAGYYKELPHYVVSGNIERDLFYDVFAAEFDVPVLSQNIANVTNNSFVPIVQVDDQGMPITTSNLWTDFIRSNWKCHGWQHYTQNWNDVVWTWRHSVSAGVVAVALVVVLAVIWRRRRHARDNKDAISKAEVPQRGNYNSVV